jgi:hypothetical protein
VTAAVREAFNDAGLVMTYPHLNVHIDSASGSRRGSGPAAYQITPLD